MSVVLTNDEKLALVLLLRHGPCSTYDMAAHLKCGKRTVYHERGYNIALELLNGLKVGSAVHHGYGRWEITEKGRIAAALVMAKEPKLQEVVA